MKLLSVVLFLVIPVLSLAQAVTITYPPAGQSLAPGEEFTVQIARPVRPSQPIIADIASSWLT